MYLVHEDDCDDQHLGAKRLQCMEQGRKDEIKSKQGRNGPEHEFMFIYQIEYEELYHVGLASAPCMLTNPQVLVTVKALTICV